MDTVIAVLWRAAALLVLRFRHNKPHHQIEIALRTVLLRTVRVPISHNRGGSVGVPAACRELCGLLCLTLWARPERAYEVPGTTGTRLDN